MNDVAPRSRGRQSSIPQPHSAGRSMKFGKWMIAGMLVASTTAAAAADESVLRPPLQVLDIAAGKWEYHGELLATADQRAGTWTWSEDCGWSANRAFMACSFTMHW